MLTISYTVIGADAVIRDLRQLLNMQALKPTIGGILADIAADAAVYPPERPNQTYIRTNTLRDGWLDSQPIFSGGGESLLAVLTNGTPYGPLVMDVEDQAAVHQGRWRTTDAIMEAWEDRTATRIEDALGVLIGA